MIKIEHLHVEEFRGIRSIDLNFDGKTFVVHGPNGSGKSGIVDAIDFALTGSIQRLIGSGTGGVTLGKHGPHVHRRDDQASAKVSLRFRNISDGTVATVTRSVAYPLVFILEPNTPSAQASLAHAQAHPELTLSRREIIKYVVSKPADRAREVEALLKLDRLEEFRKLLRTATTRTGSALKSAQAEVKTAESSFTSHLDIMSLVPGEVGRAVNEKRKLLGVPAIEPITADSDFTSGVTTQVSTKAVSVTTALREATELQERAALTTHLDDLRERLLQVLEPLGETPNLLAALKHRNLLTQGLAEIDGPTCPLCGTGWPEVGALRAHIEEQVSQATAAQALSLAILTSARAYEESLNDLRNLADRVAGFADARRETDLAAMLRGWIATLLQEEAGLDKTETVIARAGDFSVAAYESPASLLPTLTAFTDQLRAEPDQSTTSAAMTFLALAKDRWGRVRTARARSEVENGVHEQAQKIYATYCSASDDRLAELYKTVEADFSSYYRAINADDESTFRAELAPTAGSLGLAVDFYGIGMFPPTAYHSEGHQDGMGVCLYLALVKQLLGADFTVAILDDVVMSVDLSHRREFCELLKREFPDVQFIITTHDEVWARQMQSAGLITHKTQARFYGWTVDDGPLYEQGDIWERIDEDLARGDVSSAAAKLRRRLEAAAGDIAEVIGGRVEYRGDANYDLGELLSAVKGRHGALLKMAASSARSWNNDVAKATVQGLQSQRSASMADQEGEAWLVNKLVHNNDWTQAGVADFRPVLASSHAFLDLFTCTNPSCTGWIHVAGRPAESLRCDCGTYNLNLLAKPAHK